MSANISDVEIISKNVSEPCFHELFNSTTGCNETLSDDYYYDYDYSISNIPLEELLPVTVTYSITLLIGIVGNFLVIFAVCRYKRLRSITNSFLTSLAIADLLLLLVCVPIKCAAFVSFTWSFGEVLCKFVYYMQTVSMICSVMTLTVMSIERWVAILYPLKAKYLCTYSHARLVLFIVWAFSFITAIPVLIGQKHVLVGVKIKAYWCVKNWPSSKIEIVFEVYMLVLMFVIPMTVMIVAYAGICKELLALSSTRANLRVSSGKLVQQQSSSSNNGNQRTVVPVYNQPDIIYTKTKPKRTKTDDVDDKTIKVIQMLIVVVVLFSVCWGPILINNVLVAVGVIERFHYDYLKPMRQAFFLMSYFNSCSNPIVYGFMSKHFRQSFKRAILSWFCCSKRKQFQKIRYSLNATRSTALCSGRSSCSHSSKNRNKFSEDYRTEMPSPIMGIKSKSNKT